MPTCPTCQGEYSEHTWLCPECKALFVPDTRGGGQLCSQCQQNSFDRRLCPRCLSDVREWEKVGAEGNPILKNPLPYVPALIGLVGMVLGWPPHVLGSVLAVGLSLIVFLVLSNRGSKFWLSAWEGEFTSGHGVSLITIELGAFVAGLVMALLTIVLLKYWIQPPAQPEFPEKLIVSITYSLSFILFTVALTALLLNKQVASLLQRVPQPIFINTQRLLKLVLDAAENQLDSNLELKMTRFERTDDAGIHVFARQKGGAKQQWEIQADKWGRIRSLSPETEEW